MAIALVTNYLTPYRTALFTRLAERHGTEVLCFGAGERYIPAWFRDLDRQLEQAPFPARRLHGPREALTLGRDYDALIAPFAGGAILPATYASARLYGRPFILWASVWAAPRSLTHALTLPVTRRIYRDADAVLAYGEHVRRFVAGARARGTSEGVFVAPQSVEPELFARSVSEAEIDAFRSRHELPPGPCVLFAGRLVPEKGTAVLLDAWRGVRADASLVVVGDGPLAAAVRATPGTRLIGPVPRPEMAVAYALAELTVVPSIPTPRFREPWALVCNEAMHQGRPVIATSAVGAVAGGLVRDGETGVVVRAGDPDALAAAIDRLLEDAALRARLGAAARDAVAGYTYEAMVAAFDAALAPAAATARRRTAPRGRAWSTPRRPPGSGS
ncbi:MAG TPA: glycosyltransferase family 4 protein [Solirubrobacteraceae bacterium]|jgi:glycosyltransferase involved in cell wall biosynthesis|nr:glycosyltransferase family 4 protein [Solirubrobacteraceae bacterium]